MMHAKHGSCDDQDQGKGYKTQLQCQAVRLQNTAVSSLPTSAREQLATYTVMLTVSVVMAPSTGHEIRSMSKGYSWQGLWVSKAPGSAQDLDKMSGHESRPAKCRWDW